MLKRIIYLFIIMALPLLAFSNDEANALFKKGNEQYAKAHYKEAADAYQKIVDSGVQSATVYFNLGNAYYKNGDVAPAILYYEKAHKLSPGDDDINFNIQFANQKTTDKIDAGTEFFITKWWHSFILGFSLNTLAVLSILLFVVGSAGLVLYRFSNSVGVKKVAFFSAIILFVFGLATAFVASRQSDYFDAHREAIVFGSTVNVKSGPVPSSKDLFIIHEGTKVEILDSNRGWMKIRLASGSEGWINAGDAKEI